MKKTLIVLMIMVILLSACSLPVVGDLAKKVNTTLSAEPTLAISEVPVVTQDSEVQEPAVVTVAAVSETPVILFSIGMHVEPFGESMQGFIANQKWDYGDPKLFNLHSDYIRTVAKMVESHGGLMTIQLQSPFTEQVISNDNSILKELTAMGFEMALHFHEDAHLGKNSASLPVNKWCEVMGEEIDLIKTASGVDKVNYWSGGNLYPRVYQAAACAGLSVNSDWKSPETQTTDMSLQGINPWRPSGGTDGVDFTRISSHDPLGKIIFLPEGQFDREDIMTIKQSEAAGGDAAYFAYLEQSLLNSLSTAKAGEVNVFHFTLHPAEFRGDPAAPFAVLDQFLTEVIDPLVASGQVKWATFSQMADAYRAWELANKGVDPRD
ncbi:MAG: hypothetical protein NTZ74_13770 [Chloroflexi bacterium]|nr:hypothetical protein [Chloroflexota bacterium]